MGSEDGHPFFLRYIITSTWRTRIQLGMYHENTAHYNGAMLHYFLRIEAICILCEILSIA